MPKKVDHEQRRAEIAEALGRIASRQGLEGVSLRDVAAEAGLSMGAVQHYFSTKDEMLLHATSYTTGKAAERIAERVSAEVGEQSRDPRRVLRTVLVEMLPISERSRMEYLLAVAFHLRALTMPDFAAVHRDMWTQMVRFFVEQLSTAQEDGQIDADLDPELTAESLLALPDGLAASYLSGRCDEEQVVAVVDYQIDRIFR